MKSSTETSSAVWNVWKFFGFFVLAIVCFFTLVSLGLLGSLPSYKDLEDPKRNMATEVISTDGVILGKFYLENRSDARFENLPLHMQQALLATEDIRFYDHTGVDLTAIAGVIKGQLTGDSRGGGSTITQQLAKNLFPREDLGFIGLVFRKFKEWVMSVKLERSYTKNEIMVMYLNTVPFSDNAFGIKSAAYTYFGKSVDSLNIQESAVLIGMLKASTAYNPRRNPENSKKRRNVVLDQMYKYNYINKNQRDSLFQLPIKLNFNPNVVTQGLAPHFREYLRLWLKKYFKDNPKPDGSVYDVYRDGLKIYVTLDSRLQKHAENAQKEHLKEWQKHFFNHWKGRDPWKNFAKEWAAIYNSDLNVKEFKKQGKSDAEIEKLMKTPHEMTIFSYEGDKDTIMSSWDSIRYHRMILQNGFMAADPESGWIRVWVGGNDHKWFKYDHVNINTKRQIGSTFKPFIYTLAIRDKGYTPCFEVPNMPVTFEAGDPRFRLIKNWTPENSDSRYGGSYTLKRALANSVNTVTAFLMHEMTPEAVRDLVHKMGIKSDIPLQPSICLGTADISLFEMVSAYTTYANKGVHTEPIFITRIEDKNGNIIQDFVAEQNEVLDENTNYSMVEIMRHVVEDGTAQRLNYRYKLSGDMIGKTGTTQNNSDGWFIGAFPDLVAGSWVGCDDRYLRFNSTAFGQGASTALPIWAKFFQKVINDSSSIKEVDIYKKFTPPSDGSESNIVNCGGGGKTGKTSSDIGKEYE